MQFLQESSKAESNVKHLSLYFFFLFSSQPIVFNSRKETRDDRWKILPLFINPPKFVKLLPNTVSILKRIEQILNLN